jgi:hypothetical protein
MSLSVVAQSIASSFLDKHRKDDNIKVVSIGKKMFDKIEELSLGTPELLEAVKGLDNIQIITSEDEILDDEYFDSACTVLSKDKDYIELISIDEETQQLIVKIKETKGTINELIVLSNNSDGFSLINITGEINLAVLAHYSSALDFKKLKELNCTEKEIKN